MHYDETYVIEYLNINRKWIKTPITFDTESDAMAEFNRRQREHGRRTFRVTRVMSVTIAQCSRGN